MKVVRSSEQLPPEAAGAVVALGVFDGVHGGHQAVLSKTVARARELDAASAAVTFDVHPDQVLSQRPPCSLTSSEQQLKLIGRLGITYALVLEFTQTLAATPAEGFARRLFVDGLHARLVVMGRQSTFGRGREGTPEKLRRWAGPWGLAVEVVEPILVAGEPVSSTRIRQAVIRGDLEEARAMLGRPFSIFGTVVPGAGRGRTLGFPTANVHLDYEACAREGVYVGRVHLEGRRWPAAVVVGRKPTFRPPGCDRPDAIVEAYIVDFDGDLLGKTLEVELLAFLREQTRFPGPQALSVQIARDVAEVRAYFQADSPSGSKPGAGP